MKLIKSTLVGVFVSSMMFAQAPPPPPSGGAPGGPPPGGPPPSGDMQHQSATEHFMMAVQEGLDRGVLDPQDQQYLMGMVTKMQDAVKSEFEDGADGAAGDVFDEFDEWLQGLRDEGGESEEVAKRLAMELCMVESEAHRMADPDGDHDDMECQPEGGPGGPSPAVVEAFFNAGQQSNGYFDFSAAFDAAESTAKAEAQEAGEYDEESWDECADAGRAAMESARADNKSPQEVFQYIAEAVNACGESQGGDYVDHGDDHMGDDHMGDDHMGDDHGQPPFSPSIMNSVQTYKENNWAVDESKLDNQEWMDAYNSYDQWKPQGDGHMDHGSQGGPPPGSQGGPPPGGPGGPPPGGPGGPPPGGPGGPPPMPVYEDIDQDGDGAITPDEAMAFFQNSPDWNEGGADSFDEDFARVDKNDDGVVDKDEHMDEVAKVMVEEGTKAALEQGKQGAEVFEFVAMGLYDYFVMQTGWRTEDEWTAGRDAAYSVFMEQLNNGADEGAAMGAALQAGQAENDPN